MQTLITKAKGFIADLSTDYFDTARFYNPTAMPMDKVAELQRTASFNPSIRVLSQVNSYSAWYAKMLKVQNSRREAANAALNADRNWLHAA